MVPTVVELAQAVVGLAVELGYARILFISHYPDEDAGQDILPTLARIAYHKSLIFTASTANREKFTQNVMNTPSEYDATMVVLECRLEDAALLIQAANLFGRNQITWLFLERHLSDFSIFNEEYRLSNVLAVRWDHTDGLWFSDTVTLVNITLQKMRRVKALLNATLPSTMVPPSDKNEFVR